MDNEVHPDAIFGHEAQVYVRENRDVEDPLQNYQKIGKNERIKFNFTTGAFIVIPPGKISGVGDNSSINPIEETPGWNVK